MIFGCCLELLGLLLVCKLLLHIHSPEPHGRDFWLKENTLGFPGLPTFPWGCHRGESAGVCRSRAPSPALSPLPQLRHPLPRLPASDSSAVLVQAQRGGGWDGGEAFKVPPAALGLTGRPLQGRRCRGRRSGAGRAGLSWAEPGWAELG